MRRRDDGREDGREDWGYGRAGRPGYPGSRYGDQDEAEQTRIEPVIGDSAYGGQYADSDYRQQGNFQRQPGVSGKFSQAEAPAVERSRTARPYGRLSIYTLMDDMMAEFDRVAEEAAEGVRLSEPDTLVYVIHVVPKAPMQRIIYEIYRDRAAFESHESQPHIRRFAEARKSCVLATNIIDLRLKYAKVASLFQGGQAGRPDAQGPWPEPSWTGEQHVGEQHADGRARRAAALPEESGYVPRALERHLGSRQPERPPWEAASDWDDSRYPDRRYGG